MNPVLSSMIKFAILGTAGEVAAKIISRSKISILRTLYSVVVWAILGAVIKYAFVGFDGFVNALLAENLLPHGRFWEAFFKSVFINVMFGPWLIILHRLLDNLIVKPGTIKKEGLIGAMLTLLWFWIPAHTITFMLPPHQRITLAAIWSFVLGLILGIFMSFKVVRKGGEQESE